MVSFDALRTGDAGPIAFICRPKVKPAELLALFPFNGDLNDLSDYGRTCSTSNASFSDAGPLGKCVAFTGSILHTQSSQWSIDFFANFTMANVQQMNFNCSVDSSGNGLWGGNSNHVWCAIGGGSAVDTTAVTGSFCHFAFTYNGSTFSTYINGVRKSQKSVTLNAQTLITSVNKTTLQLSNLRVVGKCLTAGSTFPVPTNFYTGYEAL